MGTDDGDGVSGVVVHELLVSGRDQIRYGGAGLLLFLWIVVVVEWQAFGCASCCG